MIREMWKNYGFGQCMTSMPCPFTPAMTVGKPMLTAHAVLRLLILLLARLQSVPSLPPVVPLFSPFFCQAHFWKIPLPNASLVQRAKG